MGEIKEKPINNGGELENKPVRDDNGRIVSGVLNPNGRPTGAENFSTKWYRMIEKIADSNDLTADEVEMELMKVGYKRAKEGDYSFYRDAMDRIHGRPVQRNELTGAEGKDLVIQFDNTFKKDVDTA